MKFIQTLYFNEKINPFVDNLGWLSPEYHLMSWALSCLQLNDVYKKVDLYTSSNAAQLLVDTLGLPYNEVNITHDNLFMPDDNLWALAKIHTYSLQEHPFLHIDGDVFIFSKFSSDLIKSQLISQNLEEGTNYYTSTQLKLMDHFSFFPNCVNLDFHSGIPITAVNAGILGGNDLVFFKEYTKMAYEYVKRNVIHLSSINSTAFNVFFEQHLFYCMATEKNIPINVLINERVKDNEYNNLSDFHEVLYKKNYVHLLGEYKRDKYTCIQMASILRELYPEYYYKILSVCKKNDTKMVFSFYNKTEFSDFYQYEDFKDKSREHYLRGFVKSSIGLIDNDLDSQIIESSEIDFLRNFVSNFKESNQPILKKNHLENDFIDFSKSLSKVINTNKKISSFYLYGRDLESVHWFAKLFKDELAILDQEVIKCEEVLVIKTDFDWARIAASYKSLGRKYYGNIELVPEGFFNLIIPELIGSSYTLFDIDDLEKHILDHLIKPLLIKDLLIELQVYVDHDVVDNHIKEYNDLIIFLLKELVLKKAVKPFEFAIKKYIIN